MSKNMVEGKVSTFGHERLASTRSLSGPQPPPEFFICLKTRTWASRSEFPDSVRAFRHENFLEGSLRLRRSDAWVKTPSVNRFAGARGNHFDRNGSCIGDQYTNLDLDWKRLIGWRVVTREHSLSNTSTWRDSTEVFRAATRNILQNKGHNFFVPSQSLPGLTLRDGFTPSWNGTGRTTEVVYGPTRCPLGFWHGNGHFITILLLLRLSWKLFLLWQYEG